MKQILVIIISLFCFKISAQTKVLISAENAEIENYYNINEFYFVHQIVTSAFYMTSLHKELSINDMQIIVTNVLYKINNKYPVHILIKRESDTDARLSFTIHEGTKDGTMFIIGTNYSPSFHAFTEEDRDDAIVRWFFIKGNKLVYRKDLISVNKDEDYNKTSLINSYMFDDSFENDNQVKSLIDEIIKDKNATKRDLLYAKFYLSEYYLMNGMIDAAEKQVTELEKFFEENKNKEIPEEYIIIPNIAKTEFQLMKELNNK